MHVGAVERRSGALRPALKEKFVSIYEDIFSGNSPIQTAREEGFAGRQTLNRFWDELLLLKVNEAYLAQRIARLSETELVGSLKSTINHLFASCARYINDVNFIRVAHALETLAILFRQIFKKRFSEQGSTILALVAGSVEQADPLFKTLIGDSGGLLLRDDVPILIKSLALRLFLSILTATDNVNTNSVAAYLFLFPIADPLLAVLTLPLPADRERVALDAALLLLLLLLWRHSTNTYAALIASPAAPLGPILQTAKILLTPPPPQSHLPPHPQQQLHPSIPTSGRDQLLAYASTLLGWGQPQESGGVGEVEGGDPNLIFSSVTAGVLLLYFVLYLNPTAKSFAAWPPQPTSSPLPLLFASVFRSFVSACAPVFLPPSLSNASGCLQARLCLTLMRLVTEEPAPSDFLAACHPVTMDPMPPGTDEGRRMSTVILEQAIGLVGVEGWGVNLGVASSALTVIACSLNRAKKVGRVVGGPSVDLHKLWEGLVAVCRWCSVEAHFEKPGAPEAAEGAVGLLEFCLGAGPDLLASGEEVEALHAVVFAALPLLEALERTAERVPHRGAQPVAGGIRLVNCAEVRRHYEVTLAAMGVRGHASEAQARAAVKKKGTASFKLRGRHTGPAHSYSEGTAEHRVLMGLAKVMAAEHRRTFLGSMPKFEAEAM